MLFLFQEKKEQRKKDQESVNFELAAIITGSVFAGVLITMVVVVLTKKFLINKPQTMPADNVMDNICCTNQNEKSGKQHFKYKFKK